MVPERAGVVLAALGLLFGTPDRACAQDWHAVPPDVQHAVSGGFWQVGNSRGHHRLLIIGGDPDRQGPRLIIQWIEETAGTQRTFVRQTQPIHAIDAPWVLDVPQLQAAPNGLRASLSGSNPHSGRLVTWTIVVGPPGQYSVQPDR